jgi:hypothetical protein
MYYSGRGVPQDYKEAIKWYRLAAEQGEEDAQFALGVMYDQGQGVPQDYKEAVKWYRLAANQGERASQFNLGLMYYDGLGVPKNYVQAHMWYNLAGANGEAKGIKNRDLIAQKMTAVQIAEAQRLAREWKPNTGRSVPVSVEARSRVGTGTVASSAPVIVDPPKISGTLPRAKSTGPASTVNAERVQSIQDAEANGLVRTSYRSHEGSSSGDSILLIVVKIGGPDKLALSIPSGLVLQSPLSSSQSMVISGLKGREIAGGMYTPEEFILLTDDKPARYVVEAYCAEFHKDNPPPDKFDFRVAATPDPVLACILNGARKDKLPIAGTQAAIWIHTDHATFSEMNTRMGISKEEWSKAETVASRCSNH